MVGGSRITTVEELLPDIEFFEACMSGEASFVGIIVRRPGERIQSRNIGAFCGGEKPGRYREILIMRAGESLTVIERLADLF
jgi:hypothetical protein